MRLGGGHGAQREVDLDGLLRGALHRRDEAGLVLAGDGQPLLHADALRLQLAHGRLDAPPQVALHERLGGLDVGQPGQRLGHLADQLLAHVVELHASAGARGSPTATRRRCRTRPRSLRPIRRSARGSTSSCTLGHGDLEVGRLLGALRRGGERQRVACRRADQLLVELVGDPALPDLVGPVLRVERRRPLRRLAWSPGRASRSRRGPPGARRRPASRGGAAAR